MAVAGKDLWLTSAAFANASHRGGTLTYVASDANDSELGDPATAYNLDFGIVTRSVYDGLVAYRATGGAAGAAIVPDLAAALPSRDNGGRTYTFTIRSGVRFSNGDVVRASDVRRGLVRELTVGQARRKSGHVQRDHRRAGLHLPIRNTVTRLARGVQVDDVAGRITFRLSQADPGFLDKLTLTLVVATPKDAPDSRVSQAACRHGPVSDLRVPQRRGDGAAAQPVLPAVVLRSTAGGLSRRHPLCQAQVRPRRPGVADILAGRADVMLLFGDEATNVHLRARYPTQFHEQVWFQTHYLTLNVHAPPFDQVDTRRAVNYAFDRRRFAEILGGEVAARPACQILPPGFPGYVILLPVRQRRLRAERRARPGHLSQHPVPQGMTVDVYGTALCAGSNSSMWRRCCAISAIAR